MSALAASDYASSMQAREQVAVAEKSALLKTVQELQTQGRTASARVETLEHNLAEVKTALDNVVGSQVSLKFEV